MRHILLLLLVTCLSYTHLFSQCTETNQPKVLLVGDSWAWFMSTESTINNAFKTWGFSNYKFVSNSTLAVNGAETDDVMKASTEAEILNQLNNNPSIEVVHLSIGGNDFLGDWNVNMTQAEADTLQNQVFYRLDSIIRFIKSCKPGIHILWSGYVYTNFQEVIDGPGGAGQANQFYGTWQGMGFPTALQINTLQNGQSAQMVAYANSDPQVEYVEANGLMQYIYGQTTALGVPPGGTYQPLTAPMPLGHPDYPSPQVAMRDYIVFKDCFHLSTQGYKDLVSYQTQKFYHKFLMDDLYLLSDSNSKTGSVSSQGAVSSTPYLGESAGEQFATVLSFNTTAMADTTLEKASIFLRRKSLTGSNPVSGNSFVVKLKSGNFGAGATVEAADFTDAGDANASACNFGSFANNNDWVRIDLPPSLLSHINHNATTQFIVTAPSASSGKVEYYDATDPDFAPVLNLKYGQTPTGIHEAALSNFQVFPNPTTGLLNIENGNENITHLSLTNLIGQQMPATLLPGNQLNISALPTGMYLLNVTTTSGKLTKRIFKE